MQRNPKTKLWDPLMQALMHPFPEHIMIVIKMSDRKQSSPNEAVQSTQRGKIKGLSFQTYKALVLVLSKLKCLLMFVEQKLAEKCQ